jgi:hypothetical protein
MDGFHNCWKRHKSKTFRLGYEVKVTAVDCLDPLKTVLCCAFLFNSMLPFAYAVFGVQEFEMQLKHENFTKLLKVLYQPAEFKPAQLVALAKNPDAWDKFTAALKAKEFPCSIYIWHDPNDASRRSLTIRPL